MSIERATADDLPAVEQLLLAAGLPIEGLAGALALGVVDRERGDVVAAAGVERFGAAGLLRSVVVAPANRGAGLGRSVVSAMEDIAREAGIGELFLLTETAADWFPRLGYEPVGRDRAAAAVGASVEFTTVCRETAVAMRKRLVPVEVARPS